MSKGVIQDQHPEPKDQSIDPKVVDRLLHKRPAKRETKVWRKRSLEPEQLLEENE